MPRKFIPIEEARKIFEDKGCTLLSESCKNQEEKLDYICACTRRRESNIKDLKKRKKPCDLCHLPLIEDLVKIFANKGCILYSTECISSQQELEYTCNCSREVKDTYHNFSRREKPCPNCDVPLTETVKKLFTDLGAIPLFDEYTNTKQKLPYICKCGKKTETIYNRIIKGSLCFDCGSKKKAHGYNYVKKFFENNKCTLITHTYENSFQELEYFCSCGNPKKQKTTFNRFQQGHRCVKCANFKADLEKTDKMMKEKDCTLLTKYEDYNGDLRFICHCGNEDTVKYSYFNNHCEDWKGCKKCLYKSQRNDYNDVYDLFEEKGIVLLETEYTNRKQKMSCICVCGELANLSYSEVCRDRLCSNCAADRRSETNMDKYGVANPFQSDIIKQKMKKSLLERYGVDHNMKIEGMIEKVQQTNLEKYGEIYASKTQETKEKNRNTCIERYGVSNPMQHPEIKQKGIDTCIERYGVSNPMQHPEVFKKAMNSMFRRKEYTFPSGKKVYVQGYEPFALDYVQKEYEISEEDIITDCSKMPAIYYNDPEKNNIERRYFPDIYIPSKNIIIEVKSKFTYEMCEDTNVAKFKEVMKLGYTMQLLIFTENGDLIFNEKDYWKN